MALSDFPLVEFILGSDDFVAGSFDDENAILANARDVVSWHPHSCDCDSCTFAEKTLEAFRTNNFRRIALDDSSINIIVVGTSMTDEQAKKMVMLHIAREMKERSLASLFNILSGGSN